MEAKLLAINGPLLLQEDMRRLRHILSITCHNLCVENVEQLYHCYFTIHYENDLNRSPIYSSEVCYFTNNPEWIAPKSIKKSIAKKLNRFVFYVWDLSQTPSSIILREVIDLTKLVYISSEDFNFPNNTILFKFQDGFYGNPNLRKILEEQNYIIYTQIGDIYNNNVVIQSLNFQNFKDFVNIYDEQTKKKIILKKSI